MSPADASQPQSIELEYSLEVGKQHLHLLAVLGLATRATLGEQGEFFNTID